MLSARAAERAPGRQRLSRPGAGRRAAAVRSPVRLTGRGRIVVVLAVVALLLGTFAAGRSLGAPPGASASRVASAVTVQPGETLWDLAASAAPGADPRQTVERIRRMNDLPSAVLTPGQVLLVPSP